MAARGHGERRSGKDIAEVRKKYFEQDTALMLSVNREGLFDTLPPRLFLRLDESHDTPLKRTQAIEQQIREVRQFFLPFEQAIYHPRIKVEQLEQQWTEGFPDFIQDIWGLRDFGDALDERQRFLLCYLLPEAYRVVGNWELTGLCFEAILQKPVDLVFVEPVELENPDAKVAASELKLGEAVMGASCKDDIPSLEVQVRGVTGEDLEDFLPGGKGRQVLVDLLYSYFLPLDVAVITSIVVTEDSWDFVFGESVLGYNVQLKKSETTK